MLLWSASEPPWTPRASYLPAPLASGAGGTKRRLGQWEDAEDQDMWSSDEDGGGGAAGWSSSSPGVDTSQALEGGHSPVGNGIDRGSGGVARGSRGGGGSRREFVPRILTQDRRR